jgi:hypothetical protein
LAEELRARGFEVSHNALWHQLRRAGFSFKKSSSPPMSSSSSCPPSGTGDIVIMERQGPKLLFRPPYSPDLNPIEQVFTKLKLLLRKAAERSVEATWKRIGTLLHAFPPLECANYLRNSGYASASM